MTKIFSLFSKSKGFTLVEVVVVMGILCLGLLLVAKIYPVGFRVRENMEKDTLAAFLGQRIMEEVKKDGYQGLSENYPPLESGYGRREGEFDDHPGFYWQVEWWNTDVPDLRKVKLKIIHLSSSDKEEKEEFPDSLELVTYLARRKR